MEGVVKCWANNVALSPISFLEEAAIVYGERVSIIYGQTTFSWSQTHQRCLKLASALSNLGITQGDIVAAFAPNVPALYELHFGVPMCGGVLSALNTKLDSSMLASILEQVEAKAIFIDYEFVEVVLAAFETLSIKPPILILIADQENYSDLQLPAGSLNYNRLISMGQSDFKIIRPDDEFDPISVNYTSGSTGKPKGVIYSHRATYLNSLAAISRFDFPKLPVFLCTVDMFRCNGWCLTWALAALGGTNICTRNVTTDVIFDAVALHNVTHLCGAPAILNKIADAPDDYSRPISWKVEVVVAGALPPSRVLSRVMELGFNVSYAYGMTEVLGPVIVRKLLNSEDIMLRFRQGVAEEVDVKDPVTLESVPDDGKTTGEVMFRSNIMMSGYLKDLKRTEEAFKGGWYRTGDLGIRHSDGFIQLKDRAIDSIKLSSGEHVSTLEIEAVLLSHPKVLEAAVVARPDNVYGQRPCAFLKLRQGFDEKNVSGQEIVLFCKELLPCFMVPRTVMFGDLPVNSTGKIQKFILREKIMSIDSGY